jgi:hypothetical protein
MADASGPLSAIFSLAGAGFKMFGDVEEGQAKAKQYQAQALGLDATALGLKGQQFGLLGQELGVEAQSVGVQGQALTMRGQAAGYEFSAEKADRAADYGRLQADQTSAALTRDLNTTLGNIDAIRAAARTDPTSPTGAAVREREEQIGTEQRSIKTGNILAQANQNEADAAYYRTAATTALLSAQYTDQQAGLIANQIPLIQQQVGNVGQQAQKVGTQADLIRSLSSKAKTMGWINAAGDLFAALGKAA